MDRKESASQIFYFPVQSRQFMILYFIYFWSSTHLSQEYNFLTVTSQVFIKKVCSAASLYCDPHAKNRELDSAADKVCVYL